MPKQSTVPHGVMEGRGAYNRNASVPTRGGVLALPLWEKAVRSAEIEKDDKPVVIADYGSSQGKNSLAPMEAARVILRSRFGADRAITVFHVDQASNDFNTLFEVLSTDPDSYARSDARVYPAAIGESFYENVLPENSVHLGWSSYAAVWLSRRPALIPGHFIPMQATGTVRAEFEQQAARDWTKLLALRAHELRAGGRLVLVLPGLSDEGQTGFEHLMDSANEVLEEMVRKRAIKKEERMEMVLGAYPRHRRELLAAFGGGAFHQLVVEDLEVMTLTDEAWVDYERDGDKEALAMKHALFFRAVFVPSLACALTRVRAGDKGAERAFADRFTEGLKQKLMAEPAAMHSFVQVMVVAKHPA